MCVRLKKDTFVAMKVCYPLVFAAVWLLSLLPLRVLYVLSDVLRLLVFHVVRYRRAVVHDNLCRSFPDRTAEEIARIEKDFYAWFCDYMVETVKLCTISEREMRRRMRFTGVADMVHDLERGHRLFAFIFLAHYGNWEWVSSLTAYIQEVNPQVTGGQIYHPLRSKVADRLFLYMRSRFRGVNIPMKETLRYVLRQRQAGRPTIIGFIADQNPKWNSIHHWTDFLHRKTPVFTGTEKIGKSVDALIYYAHVVRIRRGYYECRITRLTDDVRQYRDFDVTDRYFRLLEQSIQAQPAIWLWTHKRWKRTYEEFLERQRQAE